MIETSATQRKPRARLQLRARPALLVLCALVLALIGATHLWPLGVAGGQLVLEHTPDTWGGSYYDGLAEYDHFASRFP